MPLPSLGGHNEATRVFRRVRYSCRVAIGGARTAARPYSANWPISPFSESGPETKARLAAFKQRLEQLGWSEGRNIKIEYRFSEGNPERTRAAAAELVALTPNVIVAYANPA